MNQLQFAQLGWIHAIWIVLAVAALLVFLEFRGHSVLDQLVSRVMQQRLVSRASLTRRLSSIVLMSLSVLALVLAMMRPQWGMSIQQLTRVDSQIMVCLDVSKSMLAEDVAPNRLDRAKAELDSLLSLMEEGQQVGLIAFAGKATVLCPMTTDFGFLRLILNDAMPASVGLGGTKIGEALGKAVDGFGEVGDINRVILLITDGEDHESFSLDAAKRARERGIRVVAIGFGDEAGSKIEITDPKTGRRSFVQDRKGKDVISRLDGETLRKIAMETEGVYVPAGTSALDLESIYEKHIASMLSGTATDQQRVHRNEAYQWCVLLSLVLLMIGLIAATPWSLKSQTLARAAELSGPVSRAALFLVSLAIMMSTVGAAYSQQTNAASDVVPNPVENASEQSPSTPAADQSVSEQETPAAKPEEALSPRAAYNQALTYLSSDADRAERLFEQARREAAVDGEVRYRALYNLGWVEVNRADALLKEQPEEAIKHLEMAVHRFREAIRVRPDSRDARHNLEIISRRILELSDALAKKNAGDLAARLDELIERERETQSELASLVQLIANGESPAAMEQHRASFRQSGITQRQTISDLEKLAEDARREFTAITEKKADELKDEERLRAAQLGGVLKFVEQGLQRMQKARGLTRRMQGSRAFARWSAALTETKRARDQLRNPIEVLGVIGADMSQLAQLTRSAADANSLTPDEIKPAPPAWLTQEYLKESQDAITDRLSETTEMLTAATAQRSEPEKPDQDDAAATQAADAQEMLKKIEQALPFLANATTAFREAGVEIEGNRIESASEKQAEGLAALNEAMEFFLDVRRLIERIYGEQQGIRMAMSLAQAKPQVELAHQLASVLGGATGKNLARCRRLDEMFDAEMSKLDQAQAPTPNPTAPATPATANAPEQNPEIERFQAAKQILQQVTADLDALATNLANLASADGDSEKPPEFGEAEKLAEDSIQKIEELRRLFFSLIEHLRDTGRRQAELMDETNELSGNVDRQSPASIGPLGVRQHELQHLAEQIADALRQQGEQSQTEPDAPNQTAHADPKAGERFMKAAELVGQAQTEMNSAAEGLDGLADAEQRDFAETIQHQTTSLDKIAEALQVLGDSKQNQQQNQQNQEQQQQQQQNQDEQQKQQQQQQQQQQNMDANQLLQLIRDREAQRRRDRQKPAGVGSGGVEKDW